MAKPIQHNYTKKVGGNTIIQFVGKIITTAISLVLVAALTRYLGVSGYGIYTTIFAYVSFAAIIADFGFFWVLVREVVKPGNDQQKIFNNVISIKIVFSLVVFFIAAVIAFFIPQYTYEIKIGIAIIAASWFWMSLNATYVGLFQAKLEMYKAAITDIIGRIVILAGVMILMKYQYSLETILLVYILGNFVNFVINYILGTKYVHFKFQYDKALWKMILKESFPLAILSLVGLINFKIDTVILSIMKGSTDVGIYGVPYKILEIVILIPGIFMGNMFAVFAKYYFDHDKRFNNSIQAAFDFLMLISFPVTVGLIILAKPIIRLIAGQSYVYESTITLFNTPMAAPQIMIILSASIWITFLLSIYPTLITVIGKQFKQVWPMVIITAINVILNIIFIPHYSYVAAAVTTLISEIMMLIWWKYLTHKYIDFSLKYSVFFKSALASIIMGICLYFTRSYNLFLIIVLAMVIYFAIAFILKAYDINMIKKMLPNLSKGDSKESDEL